MVSQSFKKMPTVREVWNGGNHIDDWPCFHDDECAKECLIEYQGLEYVIITDFDDAVLEDPDMEATLFYQVDEDEQ